MKNLLGRFICWRRKCHNYSNGEYPTEFCLVCGKPHPDNYTWSYEVNL